MSTHETGGPSADQPTRTETPDSGDEPNSAEDPSNRDSRGGLDVPGIGGEKTPSSSFGIKTLEFAKRAPEEWEKKLKVVLKK